MCNSRQEADRLQRKQVADAIKDAGPEALRSFADWINEMVRDEEEETCDQCGGYNYELIGCCGGHECGCVGQPVDSKPCSKCNADGTKEPSLQAQQDWPYFFLTEAEWHRHLEETNRPEK